MAGGLLLQPFMMYSSLYQRHDDLASNSRNESEKIEERELKQRKLTSEYESLTELPALSSFLNISHALDDASGRPSAKYSTTCGIQIQECTDDPETGAIPGVIKRDGFERMQRCRMALNALDQAGWKRSYHQRIFHEAYIAACARPFWKIDPPGSFARAHQKILEVNSWDNLAQEILISTPRRQDLLCYQFVKFFKNCTLGISAA